MSGAAPPVGVTVSVLAYRSRSTIERCVRSVLEQHHDGPIELLVREQGGDADERAMIDAVCAGAPSGVAVHATHGANLGYTGGHNLAIAEATQPLVLLLNADAWLGPGCLAAAVQRFAATDVGAVQPKVLRPGGDVVDSTGIDVDPSGRAIGRAQGAPATPSTDALGDPFGADGAVALYRRVALDDVAVDGEVLPADFFAYKEDVDLAYRLAGRGWRTAYAPDAVAYHERASREVSGAPLAASVRDRLAMPTDAYVRGFVNTRLALLRNERALLRPQVLAREVGAWALLAGTRPREVPRAVAGLAARVPGALAARREIAARRRP